MKNINKKNMLLILSVLLIFGFHVFRLFFSISGAVDESFNAAISYQLITSKTLLIDVWDVFQMGNSFASPFVWLYLRFTETTEGIILYLRLVYLVINLSISMYVFTMMKKYIGSFFSLCICLFFITNAPFTYYYLYYDTVVILLSFLASFAIADGIYSKSNGQMFVGGALVALLVYSYPTLLFFGVLLTFVIFMQMLRGKSLNSFYYFCAGGLTIVFTLFVYLLFMGFGNFFILSSSEVNSVVQSRLGGVIDILLSLGWAIITCLQLNKEILVIFGISSVFVYFASKKNMNKWYLVIVVSLIIIPLLFQNYDWLEVYAQFNYYLALFILVPILIFMLDKPILSKYKNHFLYMYFLSVIPFFLISISTAFASGKKGQMVLFPGAVLSLMLFCEIIKKSKFRNGKYLALIPAAMNLFLFYQHTFWSTPIMDSNYIMKSGIYKGIITTKESKKHEEQEDLFSRCLIDSDKTIFIGSEKLIEMYLYGGLEPHGPTLWINLSSKTKMSNKYFERYGFPNVVLLDSDNTKEENHNIISKNFEKKYKLGEENQYFHLYRLVNEEDK